jgi:4-amino-4-deoxy-L-arabinose transferase-like glycosyltransferase
VALCLRLAFISKGPFHSDTLSLALSAQETLATGRFHYTHGDGHPLAVVLAVFFIAVERLFGCRDIVFAVNLMSVVCGAVSVALLFLVGEKMFGPRTGGVVGLLGAFFAPHIAVSAFGSSMTLAMCLALASLTFLLRFTQETHRYRDLLAAGVFLGLCGAARLAEMALVIPWSFLVLSGAAPWRTRLRSLGLAAAAALGTLLAFFLPLLMQRGWTPFHFALTNPYQAVFLGPFSSSLTMSFLWLGGGGFGLYGSLVVVGGIVGLVLARKSRLLVFLMLWFVSLQFLYGNLTCVAMRYLVAGWLPLLIIQGYALGRVLATRRPPLVVGAWIVTAVLCARLLVFLPTLVFRHERALQVEFARWVGSQTDPGGVVIAVDEAQIIEHYAGRKTLRQPLDGDPASSRAFFDEVLEPLMDGGVPVYIISSALAYDKDGVFPDALDERYDFLEIGGRVNEDWHHILLNQHFFREYLFRLLRRA